MFGLSNFPNKLHVLHGCAHKSWSTGSQELGGHNPAALSGQERSVRWCVQGGRTYQRIWLDRCPFLVWVLSAAFCAAQVPGSVSLAAWHGSLWADLIAEPTYLHITSCHPEELFRQGALPMGRGTLGVCNIKRICCQAIENQTVWHLTASWLDSISGWILFLDATAITGRCPIFVNWTISFYL